MTRFLRGREIPRFQLNEKYASGAATGYSTVGDLDALGADGWKPAEQVAAEHLNWLASGLGALYQARVDSWLHTLKVCPGYGFNLSARCSNGFTVINNTLLYAANVISFLTDNTAAATPLTQAIVPSSGSVLGIQTALAWDTGMLVFGANTVAPTKALWRTTTPRFSALTEGPTLTGAVIGDLNVDGSIALRRDADDGAIYIYGATNDKLWRSTNNAVSFAAMGVPGRVRPFKHNALAAARGFLVLADNTTGAGNVFIRVFTAATGVWSNVTAFTSTGNNREPLAVAFSDTLGRWIVTCTNGTTAMSATADPSSTWTVITDGNASWSGESECLILDTLILRAKDFNTSGLLYSTDLGATYRAVGIGVASGSKLTFDGGRLRVMNDSVHYCTDLANRPPSFPVADLLNYA